MRRFGHGVVAGLIAATAVPAAASTIIQEYEATYYTYIYTPNPNATWYVYSEADPDNVVEVGQRGYSSSIWINMGLPGAYPDHLAGRVVNFANIDDEDDPWLTELDVPGKETGAPHYIYGGTFYPNDDDYYGTAVTGGFVEFDDEMNISRWSLVTGIYDYWEVSGAVGGAGGESYNDYFSGPDLFEELFGRPHNPDDPAEAMLWFFSSTPGTWEIVEEQAYRFVWHEREDGEYEGPDLSLFIDKESGGGGLPDPIPLPPSSVPLPASVLLLLSGLGVLGAGRVWRRRRVAH